MNTFKIDNDILINTCSNFEKDSKDILFKTDINFIQFHFCLEGKISLSYNNGAYTFNLQENNSIILFNPSTNLPIDGSLSEKTKYVSLLITIKKFHSLFSDESDQISFLNNDNIGNKLYKEKQIGPMIAIILNQMYQQSLNLSMYKLYLRGKVFELMSLYFSKDKEMDIEQCPFLADDNNIKKIKKAKEIIISRMIEPPTLVQLAKEVDISLKKLKQGFKQVYGTSVFSFLIDYKMQVSKRLLSSGEYNVNEVALKVGYSTATHFINAFKKKFGTTPKKYLMTI